MSEPNQKSFELIVSDQFQICRVKQLDQNEQVYFIKSDDLKNKVQNRCEKDQQLRLSIKYSSERVQKRINECSKMHQNNKVAIKGAFTKAYNQCDNSPIKNEPQKNEQYQIVSPVKSLTLGSLIDQIPFQKKKTKLIKKTTWSDSSSISSSQSIEIKDKSKLWTEEQNEKFMFLLKKHGPDFQLLGQFFDKKSKNQLKNKYKQFLINEKKKAKQQDNRLRALSLLFKEVDEKEQQN